jgi:hypothetical protein
MTKADETNPNEDWKVCRQWLQDQAYKLGEEARSQDRPITACPYNEDSVLYDPWHKGWMSHDNEQTI